MILSVFNRESPNILGIDELLRGERAVSGAVSDLKRLFSSKKSLRLNKRWSDFIIN